MHYHIVLTELCNSQCRYCYKKSTEEFDNGLDKKFKFDFSVPYKSQVDINKLKEFLSKDKNAVLIFYGGEPLLEIEKIKEIMDNINVPFRMQTNGKLLDKLPKEYLNKIGKILISLDGDKERTDFNRGKGTYETVIKNIKLMKSNNYIGEIIARMTISFPDVYEQVLYLLAQGLTSIHWQLDAGFYKFDFNKEKFKKFTEEYNKSISKLIDFWISKMKQGKVLMMYPFVAVTHSLLKNEKTKLRCGAGHAGYAVATDGKIIACPIMNGIEDFTAGTLDSKPEELKEFKLKGSCISCNIKDLCGGRCLYQNYSDLWPKEGNELICSTIKHLICELQSKLAEINRLIEKNVIKSADFDYEPYFGPEIIP